MGKRTRDVDRHDGYVRVKVTDLETGKSATGEKIGGFFGLLKPTESDVAEATERAVRKLNSK